MSWPAGKRCLRPPLSFVVSLLLPLVFTLVFFRTGGVLSHRSILTHRFPRFHPRNLCSLVMLAEFSLVYAEQPFVKFLSLQDWQKQNPSCSACGHSSHDTSPFCTVQLRTLCAAYSLVTVSLQPLVQALGSCPVSGDPWSSATSPSLGRISVTTTASKKIILTSVEHSKIVILDHR